MNDDHDCINCQANDREQREARRALKDAGLDKLLVEVVPLADGVRYLAKKLPPAPRHIWTEVPPYEQGAYWHWSGDEDDAPMPTFVIGGRHSTDGQCFVSAGQLGLSHAISCADYGGWWKRLPDPGVPCLECGDVGGHYRDLVIPGSMEHDTEWVDCGKCSLADRK